MCSTQRGGEDARRSGESRGQATAGRRAFSREEADLTGASARGASSPVASTGSERSCGLLHGRGLVLELASTQCLLIAFRARAGSINRPRPDDTVSTITISLSIYFATLTTSTLTGCRQTSAVCCLAAYSTSPASLQCRLVATRPQKLHKSQSSLSSLWCISCLLPRFLALSWSLCMYITQPYCSVMVCRFNW